jgi:acyl carrier protein
LTRDEFIREFADIVGEDAAKLTPDTKLAGLEGWDSVAYLSVVVLIDDRLGISVGPEALQSATQVSDLLALGDSRFSS